MRVRMLMTMPKTPQTISRASKPEAAWAGLAPAAVTPLRMTAKEEPKPTKAARAPAEAA
ncbi:hypothetical protein Acid7E03_09410 [Acidisoma sp. 7E03]